MAIQDIERGNAFMIPDPLGPLLERVVPHVPETRIADTIYFDPSDFERPIALNPFVAETEQERERVTENFLLIFRRICHVEDGPRLLDILRHVVRTLLEAESATFFDIGTILLDPDLRSQAVARVSNPVLREFWEKRFPAYPKNAIDPVVNKLGQFRLNSIVRNVFGHPDTALDFNELIKPGKLFLADLSEGKLDPETSTLIGSTIISMFQLCILRRALLPPSSRKLYTVYLDEFQNFAAHDSSALQKMFSQARNYNVSLVVSHQNLAQLPREVRSAILGNVHTIVAFRLGPEDAKLLQAAFADAIPDKTAPKFIQRLQNLAPGEAIVRFGNASNNVLIRTHPPALLPKRTFVNEIIEHSRMRYGRPPNKPEHGRSTRHMPAQSTVENHEEQDEPPVDLWH